MGKADNLINKISKYQRELRTIQEECTPPTKDIRFIDPQKGVRYVCRDCKLVLGWPSKDEIDKWASK